MRYRTSDGRTVKFPLIADGEEHFDRRQRVTLRCDMGGYSVGMRDQHVHRFAAERGNTFVHRLCAIEHPSGRRLQLQHDDAGWLREIVDGAGRAITFGYDTDGRIVSFSVPDPELAEQRIVAVRYAYDALGNLSQVGDASGREADYRYVQHQLVQHKNRNGLAFNFEYDGAGPAARCIRTWGDDGIYAHKLTYEV